MRVCRPLANAIPGGAGLRPAGRHPQVVDQDAGPGRPAGEHDLDGQGGAGPLALVGDLDPLQPRSRSTAPMVSAAPRRPPATSSSVTITRVPGRLARPEGGGVGPPPGCSGPAGRGHPLGALAGRGEAARPGPGRPASAHDSMRRVTSSSMPRTGRSSTSDRGDSRPFRCSRSRWLSDTRSTRGPPAGLRARRVSRHDLLVPDLYERLGYETFGVIEGCPAGSAARWYRKDL
jgi:hypothetical protein